MNWRPFSAYVREWQQRLAEKAARAVIKYAPKGVREDLDRKVEADANRLNAALLDAQGFIRCAACPQRFAGGLRVVKVAGRKVYLCAEDFKRLQRGDLVLG